MTGPQRPPRLLVKTLAVTFTTVALLLVAVFIVVTVSVREQVREAVAANLESTQRLFGALESRRQRELRVQAATLAESPTLKAALETYVAESRTAGLAGRDQLLATIARELAKVAARIEADAIVLVDTRQQTLAAAGRLGHLWTAGRHAAVVADRDAGEPDDGVVRLDGHTFRVAAVPLYLFFDEVEIGRLYLATSLDDNFARSLDSLSGARIAIISGGALLASTLPPEAARRFEALAAGGAATAGSGELAGESFAFRELARSGDTSYYALGSIDESSRGMMRRAMRNLGLIAVGATGLALLGSVWLAHLLTRPIGDLSASLERLASAPERVEGRLQPTGSSRELDALTGTFNALMESVAQAEAQTEAAYTGAIRALAAALDARDPYTAGHSERVSVLSVATARALGLDADAIEVIRLGALLHDIGKIGVPDEVLRKPGALSPSEYETIRQHPVLGARILRSVPFLARHIPIVELHHERPDGRGYPLGLQGEDIPIAARIVHVADAYDAMTSERAYRAARPAAEALQELWRGSGTEFHAEIVGALASALPGVTLFEAQRPAVRGPWVSRAERRG